MNLSPEEHVRQRQRVIRGEPPENIHADKVFLVRLYGSAGVASSIQIDDRTRSIQTYVFEKDNGPDFKELLPRPYTDVWYRSEHGNPDIVYRWAKRVGDWQLSLCLDRKPADDLLW